MAVGAGTHPLAPAAKRHLQTVSDDRGGQSSPGAPTQAELATEAAENQRPGFAPLERRVV